MQPGDHLGGDRDHRGPRIARAGDHRLFDAVDTPEQIIGRLHPADGLAVGRDLGQPGAQIIDPKRLTFYVDLAPTVDGLTNSRTLPVFRHPEPSDLGLGECPPEMPVGEGNPEAIRPQGVEIPNLARAIPGLAQAPTLFVQELDDRVPIAPQAKIMGYGRIAEVQLAALEGRLDPAPAAAELDVAELLD